MHLCRDYLQLSTACASASEIDFPLEEQKGQLNQDGGIINNSHSNISAEGGFFNNVIAIQSFF